MRSKIGARRLASLQELVPGTLVQPTSSSFTDAFSLAFVIAGNGRFDGHGLMPLDGRYRLKILGNLADRFFFMTKPYEALWIDGIDNPEQDANSNSTGALTITKTQTLMRASLHETDRAFEKYIYLDLETWMPVDFDVAIHHESWLTYKLLASYEGFDELSVVFENKPG